MTLKLPPGNLLVGRAIISAPEAAMTLTCHTDKKAHQRHVHILKWQLMCCVLRRQIVFGTKFVFVSVLFLHCSIFSKPLDWIVFPSIKDNSCKRKRRELSCQIVMECGPALQMIRGESCELWTWTRLVEAPWWPQPGQVWGNLLHRVSFSCSWYRMYLTSHLTLKERQ